MADLKVGLKGSATVKATKDKLASAVGSGLVDVFSTPMMIALMEEAASNAVAPELESGQATVGTSLNVEHKAATPEGMEVRAEAELIGVKGKALSFIVKAYDEKELVGEGEHQRYIIDVEKFMKRAQSK